MKIASRSASKKSENNKSKSRQRGERAVSVTAGSEQGQVEPSGRTAKNKHSATSMLIIFSVLDTMLVSVGAMNVEISRRTQNAPYVMAHETKAHERCSLLATTRHLPGYIDYSRWEGPGPTTAEKNHMTNVIKLVLGGAHTSKPWSTQRSATIATRGFTRAKLLERRHEPTKNLRRKKIHVTNANGTKATGLTKRHGKHSCMIRTTYSTGTEVWDSWKALNKCCKRP